MGPQSQVCETNLQRFVCSKCDVCVISMGRGCAEGSRQKESFILPTNYDSWMFKCVLLGIRPLDLEVTRRAISFRLERSVIESTDSWVVPGMSTWNRKLIKEHLEECVMTRWQNRWSNADIGKITYRFIPNVNFVQKNPGSV